MIVYTDDPELPMSQWEMAYTSTTSTTLTGLRIFTVYTVSVAAQTVAGIGPFDTPVQVQTLIDGKHNIQKLKLYIAWSINYTCSCSKCW